MNGVRQLPVTAVKGEILQVKGKAVDAEKKPGITLKAAGFLKVLCFNLQ